MNNGCEKQREGSGGDVALAADLQSGSRAAVALPHVSAEAPVRRVSLQSIYSKVGVGYEAIMQVYTALPVRSAALLWVLVDGTREAPSGFFSPKDDTNDWEYQPESASCCLDDTVERNEL